jgi:hypothetical protein
MTETELESQTDAPEPEAEPEPAPEAEPETEGRCEAETTVGGNLYRCALQAMHDDEHSFVMAETGELLEQEPQAQSEAELNAANRKVAAAAQAYWTKVKAQYGDDLGGFHECPLCVGYPPGLYYPVALPPEKAAQLKKLLGLPALDNFKRDNAYLACATCDGLGTILTGSKVPAHMTARCVDCAGKGFITEDSKRAAPPKAPVLEAAGNGGEAAPDEAPPFDPWGRPLGDPDYYRMPIPGATI